MQLTAAYYVIQKKLGDITVKRLTQVGPELKNVTVHYNNSIKGSPLTFRKPRWLSRRPLTASSSSAMESSSFVLQTFSDFRASSTFRSGEICYTGCPKWKDS